MNGAGATRRQVIVVGPSPPPLHGVSVYTGMVLEGLRRRGLAVRHLETGDGRPGGNLGGLDLANLRAGLGAALRLLLRLPGGRDTTVYLPLSQNRWAVLRDFTLCIVAWLRGTQLVIHLHGSAFGAFYRRSGPVVRAACQWALRRARFVVVLGESLRSVFEGLVPPDRIVVIPNGVRDPRSDAAACQVRCDDGVPTYLYLGTVVRGKGIFDLIEATRILRASDHPVRVCVGGGFLSPTDESDCRTAVAQAGVSGDMQFLGPVEAADKTRLLGSARALICPSRDPEGMPLVVLEAMAMSIPVVATPQGAIPEVVREGMNGLLVPVGSPAALASAMLRLRQDAAEAARMGRAGRALFEQSYTSERVLDDLQGLLFSAPYAGPLNSQRNP